MASEKYKKRKTLNILNWSIFKKLKKYTEYRNFLKRNNAKFINVETNFFYQFTYTLFIMCALYTGSFLPYGRFYNRLGGNEGMLFSYLYVCFYLTFSFFRKPLFLENYNKKINKKSSI